MENLAGVDEGDCLEKEITPVIICTHCRAQVDGSNVCPSDGCAVSADPFIGTQLNDRYIITSRIGAGGHGTVYRGKHRITGRHVAIKILHRDLARKHDQFNRFRQEAVALSSLDHRNLITIHDFGVTGDGLAYMIMDLLEGSSLVEIVKNNGPLPYRQALPVFREICAGVDRAHQSGIIHRDLKPGNVFISKTEHKGGRVKVLDFGLAKVEGKARVALTSPGEVFGSPAYMSPEQCRAESLDIRSDIYSMGCLMHQVLTGKPVFTADSAPELMYLHMFEEAKPCRAHNPDIDVPVVLEMVILKCLEKLPKERFQSMTELEAALSNCSV
jgi:serine/threonine-protein kinase